MADYSDFINGNPALPPAKVTKPDRTALRDKLLATEPQYHLFNEDMTEVWDALGATRTGLRDGTAQVLATGSTTRRTLGERFAETVNVRDYGAIGDGTTDDSTALQAALSAVATGGTVVVPRGTYRVTEHPSADPALTLSTSGVTVQLETGATIQFARTTTSTTKRLLDIRASNVTLRGGTLRGTWDMARQGTDAINDDRVNGQFLLYWLADTGQSFENLLVDGVRFERSAREAIQARMTGGGILKGVRVRNSTFYQSFAGVLLANFTLAGSYFEDATLEGNDFDTTGSPAPTTRNSSLGGNAMTTWGSFKKLRVVGNRSVNCGRMSLEVWHDTPWIATSHNELVEVRGNWLGASTYRTFSVGGNRVTVDSNHIVSGDYVEVWGNDYVVSANTVIGGGVRTANAAVDINAGRGGRGMVIRDNTITDDAGTGEFPGVHLVDVTDVVIQGNRLTVTFPAAPGTPNKRPPLYVRRAEGVTAVDNVIRFGAACDRWGAMQFTTVRGGRVANNRLEFVGVPDATIPLVATLQGLEGVTVEGNRTASDRAFTTTDAATLGQAQYSPGSAWLYQWNGSAFVATVVAGVTNTPPGSPATGAVYVTGDAATGAWAANPRQFARWDGATWSFFPIIDVLLHDNTTNLPIGNAARLPQTGGGTDSYLLTSLGYVRSTLRGNDFAARNRIRTTASANNAGIYWGNGWFWNVTFDRNVDWVGLAGAVISYTDITELPATSVPTSGRHSLGARVRNSRPTAGGAPGWTCTAEGVPGTWKAMASLAP